RTAMETLLSKNPNINLVYAINEPAAYGAYQALQAAGKDKSTMIVTIDGGCTGVKEVGQGIFGATSQQYPSKMAQLGMDAIVKLAKTGEKPSVSSGLDFYNTGSQLVTDKPVSGLPSITSADASKICWGK
ncbi:MAG: substrate-binding domain-containing protein, partial [Actinomycetota bacterium]|nr:substrate-binding domain-containing protein [Actinomycetota bacterium]